MFEFFSKYSSIIYTVIFLIYLTAILGQAFIGRWLANEKGRPSSTWFWLCLFFGIPALIALGFSQNKDIRKITHKIEKANNPDMPITWVCPKCYTENQNNLSKCGGCGS